MNISMDKKMKAGTLSPNRSWNANTGFGKVDNEIYLRKVFDQSIIIIHLSHDEDYLECNIHILEDFVQIFPCY